MSELDEIEIDDLEDDSEELLERMANERRHKQVMSMLKEATKQLFSYIKNNSETENKNVIAITKYNHDLTVMLANIQKTVMKPEKEVAAPVVTVNVNQDLVVNAIKKLTEDFNKKEPEKKVVEWVHTVNYGSHGMIDSVTSKAKK